MVYPRANGSRSLAKFLAFCAINLCVLHGAQATAAATCTMVVSPGDAAVGITIVSDSSCAAGGLGCINNDCRFCKTKDTPQSGHFLACSAISPVTTPAPTTKVPTSASTKAPTPAETPCPSTEAPTHAPTAAPTIAPTAAPTIAPTPAPTPSETKAGDTSSIDVCAASEGDQAVGIQAVIDDSCVNGGLGCFNGQCRFCKARDTPQSGHLTACNALDPSFPTVAPSTPSPSPSAAPGTTCGVSQSDFAVGVNAVVDPTCAFGGLGCYSDHCRFCKYRTTPQSDHFNDCSNYGTTAPTTAPADTPAPMADTPVPAAKTPVPTAKTPVPMAETLAPIAETPAPMAETLAPIAVTPAPIAATPAPTAETPAPFVPGWDTPAPTSDNPAPTSDTPAPTSDGPIGIVTEVTDSPTPCPSKGPDGTPLEVTPTPSTMTDCPTPIDPGNAAVGIQLVYDASCKNGGLGCIYDVCRYCQAWPTPQSQHLSSCTSYGKVTPTPTPAPTAAGAVLKITPEPNANITPAPAVAGACPVTVSQGDAAVGINVVTDTSCRVTGTVGCFQDICRFCKVRETPQSKHLHPCTTTTPTPAVVGVTPAPAVVTPAPVVAGKCPETVSEGDATVGINVISDETCATGGGAGGGVGCFKNVCRFCKTRDTPQSSHFLVCPTDTTLAKTPAPTETPAPFPAYDTPVPGTDFPTYDTPVPDFPAYDTPVPGYDTPAPEFPAYDTPAPDFPAYDTPVPGSDTPAPEFPAYDTPVPGSDTPAPSVIGNTVSIADSICPRTMSEGDEMVGIQIVGDASCASGGIGCIDDMCRFCKVWESKQSTNFEPCSKFGLTSSATPAPTAATTPSSSVATPSTATAPSSAITLKCGTKGSDGDLKVGIDIYTDVSCVAGGVGCFQDVCRFCKHFDSTQSLQFITCSSIDTTNGNDITFVTEPTATTPAPATATPVPTTATPTPTTATPVPAPLATSTSVGCASQVSVGDNAAGISAVSDVTCNKGGVGCFPDVACRYCQTADTDQSRHLLKCSDFTTATVASVMMAAKSDSTLSAQFSKIMKNHTMKWVVAGAACVGVAAVVAMLALAAKRIVRRASSSLSDDGNEDDEDAGEGGDVEAQEEATNLTADDSVIMTQT